MVGASWTYNVNTWRVFNGDSANVLKFVVGVSEEPVRASLRIRMALDNGESGIIGIARDGSGGGGGGTGQNTDIYGTGFTTIYFMPCAAYLGFPGIGYHYLTPCEKASSGTISMFGSTYSMFEGEING